MDKNEYEIAEKRNKIITNIFRFLFTVAIVISILLGNYMATVISIVTLIIGYLPTYINKRGKIQITPEISIIMLAFLFAANFLGELLSFYYRFWWWDTMLHTLSGVFLGFGAYIVIYMLNQNEDIGVTLSPVSASLFAFTFAVAAGAEWEIFEYFMDQVFGTSMQKSGLDDTMADLIVDSLGALFASITCYLYMKKGRESSMIKIVEKFIEVNSRKKEKNN